MSRTLRWVIVLLPCTPGFLFLAAAYLVRQGSPAPGPAAGVLATRSGQLCLAGGAVLLAGMVVGAFVAWRIAHPRAEEIEENAEE